MDATTAAAPFSSFTTSRQNLSSSPCSSLLSRKKLGSTNLKFKSPRSLSVRASSSSDSGNFYNSQIQSKVFIFFRSQAFVFFCVPLSLVVTLLDYGAGNVRSIRNALRHLGFSIKDVSFLFSSNLYVKM